MFQPPIFRENRIEVMHDLMRSHPFATIVSAATGALDADHVPLVLHSGIGECGMLRGHVGVANPLFRAAEGPVETLVVFQGPHSYITPSWYASKQDHGKVVPTWNYAIVHARGVLRFTRDPDWILEHLVALTTQQESHRQLPWEVTDAPEEFVSRQFKGLAGFEIEISNLSGVWKVSQNKAAADRKGVEAGLREDAFEEMSKLVEERGRE